MKITIVGLGLIGGSLAKDLKDQINVTIYGVDKNPHHCTTAKDLDLVHNIVNLKEGIRLADVLILAFPVDLMAIEIRKYLDQIDNHTVIIDVGSTKGGICDAARGHLNRGRYVAAHPLAGTEYSGPRAAIPNLFTGKKNIICERQYSDEDALETAVNIFRSVGMKTYFLGPEEHDRHLAYVSHLSHITSFVLGLTVLDIQKDESQILNLASTGFASTVRLAKSNPATWSAIFDKNKEHLSLALESYMNFLREFKEVMESGNRQRMEELMANANEIKKILN